MPIAPVGQTNLAGIGVPNVLVQIVPPNPLLNGVPTNVIGVVGTGTWGPTNSPTAIGSLQQLVGIFGNPQTNTYDLGTPVYNAMQQGANSFLCVRVTDGTDTYALGNLQDSGAATGATLTAKYTGTVGNTVGTGNNVTAGLQANISYGSNYTNSVPTYRLSVWLSGGVPEVFDNIGGTGAAFWSNLCNAVNNGQGAQRGPSQLVTAGVTGGIDAVAIINAGSYLTIPTVSATIGSGATLTPSMKVVSAAVVVGGTGYSVGDTLTLTGGTSSVGATFTVASVNAGAVTSVVPLVAGVYTVLPSNPAATTGGAGTCTLTVSWGVLSVAVTSPPGGTGYTLNSVLVFSGSGGATGTITVGSILAPNLTSGPWNFSGGTNGISGVTDTTLIGSDTATPRTGMYALRNTNASIGVLSDQTVPGSGNANWNAQVTFGLQEGIYMIACFANGYENNIGSPTTVGSMIYIKTQGNTGSYALKLMAGDWCQIFDPFNQVNRYTSPQGFVAGILGTELPSDSSLNKIMTGIVTTQKVADKTVYSNQDLLNLESAGIDVITKPIPASNNAYGCRLGVNSSGVATTIGDNYTRMVNFLAVTFDTGLGGFIGLPQTVDVQNQARAVLQNFLTNIQYLNMIGTLDGSPAYRVTLDSSNNPPNRVALGYMQADVQVVLWSIVFQFVVNLQAGQSVQIQVLPPQLI